MSFLLDTHTLIWAVNEPEKLSPLAAATIKDVSNKLYLSIASPWEMGIKLSNGKLKLGNPFRSWIDDAIQQFDLEIIPMTLDAIETQIGLPWHHRDPFDRSLIAQAMTENFSLISSDVLLDQYAIKRVW
jgi:PIN domain nuclease of toxin-antitoxin system